MRVRSRVKGFTLIEMLLVLVIISIIIYASVGYVTQRALQMRIDRTSTQMQQILNAGLAYYVANGQWPVTTYGTEDNITTNPANLLQTSGYLPSTTRIASPWNSDYRIFTDTDGKLFYVYTSISVVSATTGRAAAAGNVIAGTLPLAYTTATNGSPPVAGTSCVNSDTTCYVAASVNIPGQNLNNATAINFAGLYRHGGCVPVPDCPVDKNGTTMTPKVMIVPASVSGFNDAASDNVYPISSFTAYSKGDGTDTNPPVCDGTTSAQTCGTIVGTTPVTQKYWRACLQVVTEKGNVQQTNTVDYGGKVSLMALTHCEINNAPAGSDFTVFSN